MALVTSFVPELDKVMLDKPAVAAAGLKDSGGDASEEETSDETKALLTQLFSAESLDHASLFGRMRLPKP
jgi:hypothetical protein